MKPFAMKPTMTRTMIATMTQIAYMGKLIPNRVMTVYPFFSFKRANAHGRFEYCCP